MIKSDIYLTFPGNCEQALGFYRECFCGQITQLRQTKNAAAQAPYGGVLYAEFEARGLRFTASDRVLCEQPIHYGNNVVMSLNFNEYEEMKTVFDALALNGKINVPLHETLWGTSTGMLTDQFGISWIVYKRDKN